MSGVKNFVAGGVGGICCVATGHPLDTIKVRLQTMPVPTAGQAPLFTGTLDCAMKTIRNEGFFALYKGMLAPILGVSPIFAVCFFGYDLGKRLQIEPTAIATPAQNFKAGMLAGVMTTSIMVPGERIKCLLQIQQNAATKRFAGPLDVVRQLYREGGVRSLYRGTCATLLRDVPATGGYFLAYEWLKRALTPAGAAPGQLSTLSILVAGGLSGMINWCFALPADVMKSRLQTAPEGAYPNGVRSVFKELMAKEGITSLYRGATPVMLRAFPANAACFLGFEVTMKMLNWFSPPNY